MLTVRLVFKDIVERGTKLLKGVDLLSFIGSNKTYVVREYEIMFRGLIVQEPNGSISLIKPGSVIKLVEGQEYCKWHNGPLDRKDNSLERRYCVNPSRSALGYCIKHLRTDRAMYDRCVSGMGNEALEACKLIDKKYHSLEHVVYLLVLPSGKVKVGITRKFRIYERIAEQQHLLATKLTITRSVLEARRIELTISNKTRVSDKGLRDLVKKPSITIEQAYSLLENTVNNTEKIISDYSGILGKDASFFRILPSKYLTQAIELKTLNEDMEFVLKDYWGGYLFLESDGKIYAVKTTRILHKKSLILL